MSSAMDVYAPCPCGSGKKVKFWLKRNDFVNLKPIDENDYKFKPPKGLVWAGSFVEKEDAVDEVGLLAFRSAFQIGLVGHPFRLRRQHVGQCGNHSWWLSVNWTCALRDGYEQVRRFLGTMNVLQPYC